MRPVQRGAASRGTLPRRRLLQTSIPVGAAALVIACGGGKKEESGSGSGSTEQGAPSTSGTVAAQAGAVAKIKPGHYTQALAASQEEIDIAKNVRRGGSITMLYLDPPHFDAARTYSCTVFDTSTFVYNKLIKADVGAQAEPFKLVLKPDLAEKWEMTSPDATEFTFTLRKNVKWQNVAPLNGRAFNAEDVKLVFERYATGGLQKDFFSMVERLEAPDQYTLKAKMKEPYVDFPATIATYSFITPRELWMNSDKIQTEAVGTGPWIRESWTPKQGSKFRRNPDYWEMGVDGKPLPYLDRLETYVEANPAANKAAYRAGNTPLYTPVDTADGDDLLKTNPDTVWLDLPQSRGGNVNGFQFNMNNAKFKDKRVRNAISMGIDRVGYDDLFYDSLNKGYSSTSMPWTFIADQFPTLQSQGPNFQRNIAEAKKMLAAAGAENLEFEVIEYYLASGRDIFSPAQDQLREIGVKIRNRHVDNPTAVTITAEKKFEDAINMVWGPPNHSIDGWIYPWYITGGGLNYNDVKNPELDNLLKAQRKEADAAKRKEILRQIDKLLNDQNYEIWWPQGWYRQGWQSTVKNFRIQGFMGTSTCYACEQMARVWLGDKP